MANSRTERAAKKYKELFAQDITTSKTDPEHLTGHGRPAVALP